MRMAYAKRITKMVWIPLAIALVLAVVLNTALAAEGIVVIVNKENGNPVDKDLIVKIYTGATKAWPDGTPAFPLDQAESNPIRGQFYNDVIGKSKVTMRAIWAQNIFSGKALPPKLANPDEQMKDIVRSNKNAIGYIKASSADGSVKVITP